MPGLTTCPVALSRDDNLRFGGDAADIRRDALAHGERHVARPHQADQAIELQRFVTRFLAGRNVRQRRRMLKIGQGDRFHFSGQYARPHDGVGADKGVDAPLGKIVDGRHRVLVRDLRHLELFGFQEGLEHQIVGARHRRIIQLARRRFDLGDQFLDARNSEFGRHREHDQCIGHARDRHQILDAVGQLVVQQRMRGEGRGRREQQDMVVMRADHRRDGDDRIAARLVLDHHRLAPFGRQLVGKYARGDVDAGAWSKRNDEPHRPRRPRGGLRERWRRAREQGGKRTKDQSEDRTPRGEHGCFL